MNCPRVLLTGANGFIGAHVLDVLLKNGAFVQAIVRGPEKAARLRKDFSAFEKTRLDFSIVPDITVEGCFDKCMQECQPLDAVVHTAAPLAPTEFSKSLGPMLQGTLEILRSVSRHAPTVKRVVITGSFSSIGNVLDIQNGGIVYSSDSWNPITMEQAKFSHGEVAYWAGKTIAEKAGKRRFHLQLENLSLAYSISWQHGSSFRTKSPRSNSSSCVRQRCTALCGTASIQSKT